MCMQNSKPYILTAVRTLLSEVRARMNDDDHDYDSSTNLLLLLVAVSLCFLLSRNKSMQHDYN